MVNNSTSKKSSPTHQLPKPILNINKHIEETFDLWNIQNPSWKTQVKRSLVFVGSLLIITFWPATNIISNLIILLLAWLLLALTDRKIPSILLMLNLQLNLAILFQLVNSALSI